MKKCIVFSALALLVAAAFVAPPARALTLSTGEYTAKFSDHSNLYYVPDGGGASLPRPLSGVAPTIGDEDRAIFRVTTILDTDTDNPVFQLNPNEELTGVFYDLGLSAISGNTLDFSPLGRNPVPGAGTTYPAAFGGVLEIYLDTTPDYTADPGGVGRLDSLLPTPPPIATDGAGDGPTYWVEGTGGASRDSYPKTTDGTLWLQVVFVDFATAGIAGHAPGTVLSETIDFSTGVGSGTAYGYIVGGTAAAAFQRGLYGPYLDIQFGFDVYTPKYDGTNLIDVPNYSGLGYWQVDSQDPAGFGIIPEPATLSLLAMSIFGLGGLSGLRRRKA